MAATTTAGAQARGAGRIVVGGGGACAAARFLASGARDTTFGSGGSASFVPISGHSTNAYGFALDARVVLAGDVIAGRDRRRRDGVAGGGRRKASSRG